jgi:hypothetical protein
VLRLSSAQRTENLTPAIPFVRAAHAGGSLFSCSPLCDLRHSVFQVLPESHRVIKLGGQVSFAQHLKVPFFGTTVQSDHELGVSPKKFA